MQGSHAWSYSLCRVPTPPGKSWNCVCKISITWKVLENKFGHLHYTIRLLADLAHYRQIWRHPGPGKWVWSWKVLEFARQWCRRYNMCVHTPLLCSSSFFAIPSQHVTVMNIYSSMNAAIILYIYMVSNCCLSLYLNIAGLLQGPGKCFWVHGKVLEFFVTKRVGTLFMDDVIFAGSSWPDPCSPTAQRK